MYFWDPTYPSIFKVNPGYNFTAEAVKAGLPASTPVPAWAQRGSFDPGAVLIANTPEFQSRTPQIAQNFLFAPRVGLAFQVDSKTVIRASGGKMYLPTTGNPNSYASSNANVALSDQAFAGWHASQDGGRTYISTSGESVPTAGMFTTYTRNVKEANLQSSLDPGADLTPANYQDDKQVLHSPVDPITAGSARRLDPTKVVGARVFVSGNLPPVDPNYRNPENHLWDISLMKNFTFGEGRYLQIRGGVFCPYQSQIGNVAYGLITTAGNQSRQNQLSARINF